MVYFPDPAGLFVQLFLLPSNPEFPAPLQDFVRFVFFWDMQWLHTRWDNTNCRCKDHSFLRTELSLWSVFTTHLSALLCEYLHGVSYRGTGFDFAEGCLYGSSDVVLSKPWLGHIPHPLHTIFDSQGWWGSFSSEAKKSPSLQNSQHSPTHHCKHPVRCHGNFYMVRNQRAVIFFHSWLRPVF